MSREEAELTISNSHRRQPIIEQDEYQFIPEALDRWADRKFKHSDPWRSERSQIRGIWA